MSFDNIKKIVAENSVLVCHGDDLLQYDTSQTSTICFRFVKCLGESPFASHYEKSTGEYKILSSCCSLHGSYRDQALNRPLAEAIFQCRPSAVYVKGLYGCTCDLPRIAHLLDTEIYIILGKDDFFRLESIDDRVSNIVYVSLQATSGIIFEEGVDEEDVVPFQKYFSKVPCYWGGLNANNSSLTRTIRKKKLSNSSTFDYALYELMQRDHPLLYAQQKNRAIHFKDCKNVLDLGCGVGVFLDVLRSEGVPAEGVERNPDIARYGREMGFEIIEADAIDFLSSASNQYDGIYCSHFIEHLPFEAVKNLILLISSRLQVGGMLVLAFPDPESIRAQLLGFWRDPEHVRFYHPHLVVTLARACGLECEWSSYDDQPHEVVPFPLHPPALHNPTKINNDFPATGIWERIVNGLGFATKKQLRNIEEKLELRCSQQDGFNKSIAARTDVLWTVNNTWGWNDDVTLRFRKH